MTGRQRTSSSAGRISRVGSAASVIFATALVFALVQEIGRPGKTGVHPPVGKRAGMYPNDWFHRQRAYPERDYPGSAVERAVAEARVQRDPMTWGPAPGAGVERRDAVGSLRSGQHRWPDHRGRRPPRRSRSDLRRGCDRRRLSIGR